jgi:hypothetical protein
LKPGWHEAKLSITDYPVQFDDDYYLTFFVAERINVLNINELQPNTAVEKAFSGAKFFNVKNQSSRAIDYSKLSENQAVFLQGVAQISSGLSTELLNFVKNGGHVLVFPPANADLNSYKNFLQNFGGELGNFEKAERQVTQINTEEFIFRDVFLNKSANLRLPSSSQNFKIPPNRGENLLTYRDGSPFLVKYSNGLGALYLSAVPLDESSSNLIKSAEIFVPLLFKVAISGGKSSKIAWTIGRDEVLEARHQITAGREQVYKLKGKTEQQNKETTQNEFIPEQRIVGSSVFLTPGTQLRDAGFYELFLRPDSILSEFGFNFDRKESALDYFTTDELENNLPKNMKILSTDARANLTQIVDEQNQGIVLWRWCIIFALLFLALESLFLRLWKV